MKVKSVRYFETNRGVGYEAKTNNGGSIWNDGNGGETYFIDSQGRYTDKIDGKIGMSKENYLESLINKYENIMKKYYLITNEIRDGEHEYHDTGIWMLNDDPSEKEILIESFFGHDKIEQVWNGWEEKGCDYRIVNVHSIKEIDPKHLDILKLYI